MLHIHFRLAQVEYQVPEFLTAYIQRRLELEYFSQHIFRSMLHRAAY